MKTIYLIGGTMGVGKTTVSQQLKKELPNSVFLDGDWCWDADPFQVTEETKAMVMLIDRSVARINMYQILDTIKVDTVNKNVCEIGSEILTL